MMRVMKAGQILLLASALAGFAAHAAEEADRLFSEKVWPLLDSRCVSCHGPDKVKGSLRLDSREAVLKAGESGQAAVVPGKPADSLLLHAVMHSKKDLEPARWNRFSSLYRASVATAAAQDTGWPE